MDHKKKRIIEETKNFCTLYRNLFAKTDNDNPAENVKVKTGIEIVLPDNLTGILITMLDIRTFKLKCQNIVKRR